MDLMLLFGGFFWGGGYSIIWEQRKNEIYKTEYDNIVQFKRSKLDSFNFSYNVSLDNIKPQ